MMDHYSNINTDVCLRKTACNKSVMHSKSLAVGLVAEEEWRCHQRYCKEKTVIWIFPQNNQPNSVIMCLHKTADFMHVSIFWLLQGRNLAKQKMRSKFLLGQSLNTSQPNSLQLPEGVDPLLCPTFPYVSLLTHKTSLPASFHAPALVLVRHVYEVIQLINLAEYYRMWWKSFFL